ncbi:acetamidase [Peribacillus saganii]|uniref:Acetamidase n=1 Tax=Peribacillus saganii TaxID=2303992 RepID=A0A372LRR1_9BACI|nr:acetamidase/formamidase family protein [Peribacillus saganii]RFU70510.1 acetamidase [Peribacillus saganii]
MLKQASIQEKKGTTHYCPDKFHFAWDKTLAPTLTIESGDTVVFEFRDGSDRQIGPGSGVEAILNYDWNRTYPLHGPIYVNGAEPGDTLEIEILDLRTKGWGWTGVIPGFGLLSEEFSEPYLRVFDISNGDYIPFREDIHVPIEPFLGLMGVAPSDSNQTSLAPPDKNGGNMDIRHLTQGARLFLPIEVEGALFSAGDGHAAQGDGEICLTAVECPLYGSLKFTLHKNKSIPSPQFITAPGSLTPRTETKGFFATTGVGPDLMVCAQDAARAMVDHLEKEYGLPRYEAYLLCSLAVDLKISEIVDKPNYIVSAYLPLSIFK